jgi:hypothetical protein
MEDEIVDAVKAVENAVRRWSNRPRSRAGIMAMR